MSRMSTHTTDRAVKTVLSAKSAKFGQSVSHVKKIIGFCEAVVQRTLTSVREKSNLNQSQLEVSVNLHSDRPNIAGLRCVDKFSIADKLALNELSKIAEEILGDAKLQASDDAEVQDIEFVKVYADRIYFSFDPDMRQHMSKMLRIAVSDYGIAANLREQTIWKAATPNLRTALCPVISGATDGSWLITSFYEDCYPPCYDVAKKDSLIVPTEINEAAEDLIDAGFSTNLKLRNPLLWGAINNDVILCDYGH